MIRSERVAQLLNPGQRFGKFTPQFPNLGLVVLPDQTRPRSHFPAEHHSYLDARAARTTMSHAWSVLNPSSPRSFAGRGTGTAGIGGDARIILLTILKSDGLRTRINSPAGVSGIGSAKTGFNNPASIASRHLSYTFISISNSDPSNAISLSFHPSSLRFAGRGSPLIPGLVARAIVGAVCLVIPIPHPLQIGGAGAAHGVLLAVGFADVQARVDLVLRMASLANLHPVFALRATPGAARSLK